MSPSSSLPPPTAITQLRQIIHYNLDNDLLQNALFLSGRLHGLDPRAPETVHLVALSHLKLGHFRAAYDYAKDPRLPRSHPTSPAQLDVAYVFAQACLALRRYGEGIAALERCRNLWQGRNHLGRSALDGERRGPDAPAVCNLLGKLCRANGEEKKAAEWFAESLKGNPFMWDAFVELSDAGMFFCGTNADNVGSATDLEFACRRADTDGEYIQAHR
jgi:anaphase-promoting complex subunit 3